MSTHYGRTKARLTKAAEAMKRRLDFQQFGQANDSYVWQGATACTHTICQSLYYIWFGKVLTLNRINTLAGMPVLAHNAAGKPRGMNSRELQRFFDATGLPYVVRFGLTFRELLTYSNRAPVMYGMRYGTAPEWPNYVYQGHRARAPFALHGGKTQLVGAESIRHAVLMLGYRQILDDRTGKAVAFHVWRKEPNHHSPARQERPPFDVITAKHAQAEYDAYTTVLGNTPYAAIPTRSLPL